MTTTEQHTTDLFHQIPPTVSCISSNVGSITDFILNSKHSSFNNDEQRIERSKQEDMTVRFYK